MELNKSAAAAAQPPVELKKRAAAAAADTHANKNQNTGKWKIAYGLMSEAVMKGDMDAAMGLAVEWYVPPKPKRNAAAAASSPRTEWL